jgi:hypothetical protein
MVTVVKTPTGNKIIDQAVAAEITNSAGDALVTMPYHGLGTGDYVYVTSDLDEYNGFWYVTAIDTNSFKLSEYTTAEFVEYYQDEDIEYYQTQPHDWHSIFLPIIYKVSNNRWPVNTIDTVRTVSSFSDDNGYTTLTLSGNVRAGGVAALSFVKISGAGNLNGVYQIAEVITQSQITITLAYDAGYDFTGATVQYYYNSYQVKVKVFSGLDGAHPWVAKKPFTEVAELSFTPDGDNLVMFSVSEYIKSKVAIKNNPTLFSMPLNLDAFTEFYVSTAEAYDESDGYTLFTEESSFVDNGVQGYAIAGKLPFKNIYAGEFADYVYTPVAPAKWLTLFTQLIAVEDKYFDISFIKNFPGAFELFITKYISDYVAATEAIVFADQGIGVYRLPVTVDSIFDRFCVQVRPPSGATPITLPILTSWATRSISGTLIDWTTGASPTVSLAGGLFNSESSEQLWVDFPFEAGNQYTVTITFSITSVVTAVTLYILNSLFSTQFSVNSFLDPVGVNYLSITFTATGDTTRIAVSGFIPAQNSTDIELLQVTGTVIEENVGLTEEICIDIIESCEAQNGIVPSDIRLLEDGNYRLLE